MNKTALLLTAVSLTLSAGWIPLPHAPASSASASVTPTFGTHQKQAFQRRRLQFPVRNVRPTRRMIGGIARSGSCTSSPVGLTPLLPIVNAATSDNLAVDIEMTVAEHPTIFVYIPPSQANWAEFALQKGDEAPFYQSRIPLPEEGRVISIPVPNDTQTLEIGQDYRWSLMLMCKEDDLSENPLAQGWVQRVELSAAQRSQLDELPLRDRPAFYVEAGMWLDALSNLAELQSASPNDTTITEDWVSLLTSVQMQQVATVELLTSDQLQIIAAAPLLAIDMEPLVSLEEFR